MEPVYCQNAASISTIWSIYLNGILLYVWMVFCYLYVRFIAFDTFLSMQQENGTEQYSPIPLGFVPDEQLK